MLEHGGRLRAAARRYGIPLSDWLDLSTGINPTGWPVPALPPECWQRLPEDGDGLEAAAAACYGNERLLPLPGSQAAIMALPELFPKAHAAFVAPIYREHPHAWAVAGHRCLERPSLAAALASDAPVVVLCNPNNPTGEVHSHEALLVAAGELGRRGGWLVVDEAFADPLPGQALAPLAGGAEAPNLVVLRSLGKFFGLAGARVGFAFGAPQLLARLAERIGPWAVSGPAREAARLALADSAWQRQARERLASAAARLGELLAPLGAATVTPLFVALRSGRADELAEFLARHAILVRRFDGLDLLRFGLPGNEAAWQRLSAALDDWKSR